MRNKSCTCLYWVYVNFWCRCFRCRSGLFVQESLSRCINVNDLVNFFISEHGVLLLEIFQSTSCCQTRPVYVILDSPGQTVTGCNWLKLSFQKILLQVIHNLLAHVELSWKRITQSSPCITEQNIQWDYLDQTVF